MRKLLLGLVATAAIAAPLMTWPRRPAPHPATSSSSTATSRRPAPTARSSRRHDRLPARRPRPFGTGNGNMYDPGRYTIGTNPAAVHEAWADFGAANDPMMIVNGFTTAARRCGRRPSPRRSAPRRARRSPSTSPRTRPTSCRPSGHAAVDDAGANISVTVNGTHDRLAGPDRRQPRPGRPVRRRRPGGAVMEVTVWNNGTAYTGNDFAIDDISLIQRGDCEPPCQTRRARRLVQLHRQVHRHRSPGADRPEVARPPGPARRPARRDPARLRQAVPARRGQGQGRLVRLEGPRHDLPDRPDI